MQALAGEPVLPCLRHPPSRRLKLYSEERRELARRTLAALAPAARQLAGQGPLAVGLRGLEYMNDDPSAVGAWHLTCHGWWLNVLLHRAVRDAEAGADGRRPLGGEWVLCLHQGAGPDGGVCLQQRDGAGRQTMVSPAVGQQCATSASRSQTHLLPASLLLPTRRCT